LEGHQEYGGKRASFWWNKTVYFVPGCGIPGIPAGTVYLKFQLLVLIKEVERMIAMLQCRSHGSEGKRRRRKISEYMQLPILFGGCMM